MNGSEWSTCEGGNFGASTQYDIVFDGKLQSSFRQSYQDTPLISCHHQFHASSRCLHFWFLSGSLSRCWFRFLHYFPGKYKLFLFPHHNHHVMSFSKFNFHIFHYEHNLSVSISLSILGKKSFSPLGYKTFKLDFFLSAMLIVSLLIFVSRRDWTRDLSLLSFFLNYPTNLMSPDIKISYQCSASWLANNKVS